MGKQTSANMAKPLKAKKKNKSGKSGKRKPGSRPAGSRKHETAARKAKQAAAKKADEDCAQRVCLHNVPDNFPSFKRLADPLRRTRGRIAMQRSPFLPLRLLL